MIQVVITKNRGKYKGFLSRGHAGYAEEGHDIVCAAVSALVITTANALEALTEDRLVLDSDDGFVKWEFPDGISEKGTLLMDALVLGLTGIRDSYDKKYIRLETREV